MKDFAKKRQFLDERVEPSIGAKPAAARHAKPAAAVGQTYQAGRPIRASVAPAPRKRIKLGPWLVLLVIILLLGSVIEKGIKTYQEQHPTSWQEFFKMLAHKPGKKSSATDAAPPAASEPSGPTFDFYTVLPGQNTTMPTLQSKPQPLNSSGSAQASSPADGQAASNTTTESTPATPPVAIKPQYLLVVGAYKTRQQAMDMHSRLSLMNISSHVTEASVRDKLVYRVELGPYDNKDVASSVRDQIQQQGVFGATVMTINGNTQ